jgi:hypothetical protein
VQLPHPCSIPLIWPLWRHHCGSIAQAAVRRESNHPRSKVMSMMKNVLAVIAVALMGTSAPAGADDNSNESFRTLTTQYWQWATSIPLAFNPLTDSTGANCVVGQRGPVWFLATSFTALTRLQNLHDSGRHRAVLSNSGRDQHQHAQSRWSGPRQQIGGRFESRSGTHRRWRSARQGAARQPRGHASAPRSFRALHRRVCPRQPVRHPRRVPGFPYSPAVDDGYYVKLNGLSEGMHHLKFEGELPAFGFSVTVDYVLNVVKAFLKD